MDIEIFCNTADELLFKNIGVNSKKDLPWVTQLAAHEGHAVIVGGGPSAADCLDSIRWRQGLGQKVFALNNAAKFLASHGITADYQVIVDAREHNRKFIGNARECLLSSQCDPSVIDAAQNVTLWHPVIEGIVDVIDSEREYALIGGGTTVGLSAMCLAFALGYRKLHLFGYDSSHRGEAGHAYEQPENAREPVVKVTAYGKTWDCSLAMAYQAELFPDCANKLLDLGCVITMDGEGLLPTAFRHLWGGAVMDEATKYQMMWELPAYSDHSPGEEVVDTFLEIAKPSGRVIDFGCGTGRAGLKMAAAGLDVLLTDFADNSRDPAAMHLPFLNLDLRTHSPGPYRSEFGYCTDVMEHIEPHQVDAVIRNVMGAADSVFFQISLVPDNMGTLIGQQLHLSVHSMSWWRETFLRLGYRVEWEQNRDHIAALFYITQPLEAHQ